MSSRSPHLQAELSWTRSLIKLQGSRFKQSQS